MPGKGQDIHNNSVNSLYVISNTLAGYMGLFWDGSGDVRAGFRHSNVTVAFDFEMELDPHSKTSLHTHHFCHPLTSQPPMQPW